MKRIACEGLTAALNLGSREHLALVGGGGKTTLLRALARELAQKGARVVATTTTKVRRNEAFDMGRLILTDRDGWRESLERALETEGIAFLGCRLLPTGKVEGVRPELPDLLFSRKEADVVLVEADGAAGRPLKAPKPSEPVIPSTVTGVVAVAGLEALDRPLAEDHVFRMERFRAVTGLAPGSPISASAVARLFSSPAGLFQHTPEGVRRTAFFNKLDRVEDARTAHELAQRILDEHPDGPLSVILGSLFQGTYLCCERT